MSGAKRVVVNTTRGFKNPTLFWYQFSRKLHKNIEEGHKMAAYRLWQELREVVNTPYPPSSTDGNPPHRRTGVGRDSIQVSRVREGADVPDSYEVYVEDEGDYMVKLEFGFVTRNNVTVVRPWFWTTAQRMEPELESLRLVAAQFNYY